LRGYDAVHLAAASVVGADVFSSADVRRCMAASSAGFHVANPTDTVAPQEAVASEDGVDDSNDGSTGAATVTS
jgi:hypothetical protein